MKKSSAFYAFVLSSALFLPMAGMAADDNSTHIEKLISEFADKPEQHQAITDYYQDKIAEAKKDLAMHSKMRKAYEVGFVKDRGVRTNMSKHCDKLISNAESNIKVYEAMAAEHEAMATKKP